MCTMSVIRSHSEGIRVAFNRDELHNRSEAFPPEVKFIGDHAAIMPIDPISGGTWTAVNDAGLVLCLLNRNPGDMPPVSAIRSRGTLIPHLADCSSIVEVCRRLEDVHSHDYGPFRLVTVSDSEIAVATFDGREMTRRLSPWGGEPILFTSSGLGDHIVESPRRRLFDCIMDGTAVAQDQFHRHSWPHAGHLSVCMRREDAQTVSLSIVTVNELRATFRYCAGPPDCPSTIFDRSIDRTGCIT